ncbi:MAG TPA: carboxypeptidase-like regulatory domain-containing protein, partial [Terriglobia bacterium]|nr:carboxypeptidase-like regulatory domain-containing protein [Terriglobia bacterium]
MPHRVAPHQRLHHFLAVLLVGVAIVVYSPRAAAQGSTGAINGTITDSTGAVIPKASIALTNSATGAVRTATSNDTGNYVFPEVLPGVYTLVVTAEGFTTAREEKFTLNVNQTQTHNFALAVGTTKQEVTVSATATHIESSTAELGTAVASREVNDLPLNGRNFTQLLQLTPGVSPISTAQNAGGGG